MKMAIRCEKQMLLRSMEAALGVVALLIGGLIYVRYRSENLLMFEWFHYLGLSNFIEDLRVGNTNTDLNGWVMYSMPAGLWLLSYLLVIDAVWGNEHFSSSKHFLFILPLLALASEVLQLLDIFPGSFDFMDLLSYILAILTFIIIKLYI